MACTYEVGGKVLNGKSEFKAYLINGGLNVLYPMGNFPWGIGEAIPLAKAGEPPSTDYKASFPIRSSVNPFESSKEFIDHLVEQFGPGINRLVETRVLNFTKGKKSWPKGYRGDEEAVYLNGRAYIDLLATDRNRAVPVVLHELGEHFNLARMLGAPAYSALQGQIKNRARIVGSQAYKVWNEVARNYGHLNVGDESFIAEVIAKLGETNPNAPWYRRLVSQIKAFLMQHGLARGFISGTLTEKDMHSLLVASLHSAIRGRTKDAQRFVRNDLAYSRRKGAKNDYQTDMFGDTLPDTGGEVGTSETTGNVHASTSLRDTAEPMGTFATKTAIFSEIRRELGTDKVTTPAEAAQAVGYLGKGAVERFDALITDKNGKPLAIVGSFKGAIGEASVFPSTVVAEAFRIKDAANIWFTHNHPSGVVALSTSDIEITKKLQSVFDGSSIKAHGILAMTHNGDWVYENPGISSWDDYSERSSEGTTTAPTTTAKVAIIERTIDTSGKLGVAITSPDLARSVVPKVANGETGLILTDNQHTPVAFLPMTPDMARPLKNNGGMDNLYRAMSVANAKAAFIYDPQEMFSREQYQNIGSFLAGVDANLLDVLVGEKGAVQSLRERGETLTNPEGVFYSRPNRTIEVEGVTRPTTDAAGKPLHTTEEGIRNFWKWFGNSKAVDSEGHPLHLYHGTTADFTEFNRNYSDSGSDLGAGFYFSNETADAADNYAGLGPDLKVKIDRMVDQLESHYDNAGIEKTQEELRAEAAERYMQHNGVSMPVYLQLKNPVIIGGPNETYFDFEEAYDEETEEYGEPEGALAQLISAIQELGYLGDFTMDTERAVADLYELGEAKASTVIETLKESLEYAENNEDGNLASSEIIRRAFEQIGFDGFIDNSVDIKFGSQRRTGTSMSGMNDDTSHFIVFEPTQIKSAIGNTGEFNPNKKDIRYSRPDTAPGTVYISEEQWGREIRNLSYPDDSTRGVAIAISPDDFLALVPDSQGQAAERADAIGNFDNAIFSGDWLPSLDINTDGKITDHEGRARAELIKKAGLEKMPVILRLPKADRIKSIYDVPSLLFAQDSSNIRRVKDPILLLPNADNRFKTKTLKGLPLFSRPSLPESVTDLGANLAEQHRTAADTLYGLRTALLSVQQMVEQSERYLPAAGLYEKAMRGRRNVIDTVLRGANHVLAKWKTLPKILTRKLNKLIQSSTIADVNAAQDWAGVTKNKGVGYAVHSQMKWMKSVREDLTRQAKDLGAIGAKGSGFILERDTSFANKSDADAFLEILQEAEVKQTAFRERNGYPDPNVQAKRTHEELQAVYKTLPATAQEVYVETSEAHNRLAKDKQDALIDRIQGAILNGNKREQAIAKMRDFFESNSLTNYYAPLSRFGKHWFYGEDAQGNPWFKTFESTKARDIWKTQFEKDGGKGINDGTSVREAINTKMEGVSDTFILDINNKIASALPDDAEAREALQDDIYQMYLATLPDVSMRHHSMHRKNILGFEEDAMRSYSYAMHHGASQLANMTEGRKMDQALKDIGAVLHLAGNGERQLEKEIEIDTAKMLRDNWGKVQPAGDTADKIRRAEEELENAPEADQKALKSVVSAYKAKAKDEAVQAIGGDEKALRKLLDKFGTLKEHDAEEALNRYIEKEQKILDESRLLNTADLRRKAADIYRELLLAFKATVGVESSELDKLAGNLKQFTFMYLLGGGISTGIVNAIQVPVAAGPILAGKYGYGATTKAIGNAYSLFTKALTSKKLDSDGNASIATVLQDRMVTLFDKGAVNTPEVNLLKDRLGMLEYFKNDGTISRTQTMDIIGTGKEGEQYGGKLQDLSKLFGWMFHHGERMNREITLLAAYDLARANGVNDADARVYARSVNNNANGDYSPENAARIFRGWPASIALQFAKYPQAMYYLWGKTFAAKYNGWKKMPDKTEEEKAAKKTARDESREAGKTLGALMLMQTAVAGALGLPLTGALGVALELIANAGSDDDDPWDFKREVRVGLKDLGTEIGGEYFGEKLSSLLAMGALNTLTPMDFASRTSLANIKFRDQKADLEGRDWFTNTLASLFGPVGGVGARLAEGGKLLMHGDTERGVEQLLPKAFSDIAKSFRFSTEDARSLNGDKLKDMRPVEILGQLIGMGSSDLETKYAERGFEKDREKAIIDAHTELLHKAVRAKQEHEVQPLVEIRAWNLKHPAYKINAQTIEASLNATKRKEKKLGAKGYSVSDRVSGDFDYSLVSD